MISLDRKHAGGAERVEASIYLDFAARQRGGRQRLVLDSGQAVELDFVTGHLLADGDILTNAAQACFMRVTAACEALSYVHCADKMALNELCYHLGERGVALQVHADAVVYRHDPDLDAAVAALGMSPRSCRCAFHPDMIPARADLHGATIESQQAADLAIFDYELRQATG